MIYIYNFHLIKASNTVSHNKSSPLKITFDLILICFNIMNIIITNFFAMSTIQAIKPGPNLKNQMGNLIVGEELLLQTNQNTKIKTS